MLYILVAIIEIKTCFLSLSMSEFIYGFLVYIAAIKKSAEFLLVAFLKKV